MEKDDPRPETQPAGNRPPPRPPRGVVVGLGPEGDDSSKRGRATITKAADGEGKFIRQSGGRGQYGHVLVRIEPDGRSKGVVISNNAPVGSIPSEYIEAATKGIRDALASGMAIADPALDGKRVVDIVVRIVGGSSDKTDSNELAFIMAGIFAIKDAIKKAEPGAIE